MSNGDDIYYLRRARDLSAASDDPSTKVGGILTTATCPKKILYGIPSRPVGINRVLATLPREDKLKLIIHA
jgi:hypothetical protein